MEERLIATFSNYGTLQPCPMPISARGLAGFKAASRQLLEVVGASYVAQWNAVGPCVAPRYIIAGHGFDGIL